MADPKDRLRLFVVVSGLPGSGKTTLARQLADHLHLPLLDKDDILERRFASHEAVGLELRQRLSRASDDDLSRLAQETDGAVLVSFWRRPGLISTAGTPTDWITELGGHVVEVYCDCPVDLAETRFRARRRHPGHNDEARSGGLRAQLERLHKLGPLNIGPVVRVSTAERYDGASVADQVRAHSGPRS